MSIGPYKIKNKNIIYVGNKIFTPLNKVRGFRPPKSLSTRHVQIRKDFEKWEALIKIWDGVFRASNKFMEQKGVLLFDLPITTRMISSPGALTGTISSDVEPFKINFFTNKTFLTQSSQLYLEFAITNPKLKNVYCFEKSFRREKADYRHLPEFTHIEFESNINFQDNLKFQQEYLQFMINYLIKKHKKEMTIFLNKKNIEELKIFCGLKNFERITFCDAFKLLKKKTNDRKYDKITVKNFGDYEEILLTEIIGKPVFVTHYIEDEVAFYHARDSQDRTLVINADFLFPGYGELIGSGERVRTKEETRRKAEHFKLDIKDYNPYIESRNVSNPKIHSGWGMGIERFVQALLKLPFIWEAKAFPRVDNQNHP